MGSAGELITRRELIRADNGYAPGQHQARIIDPHPHRDRADLAAVLTYVDGDGRACSVTCMRYRDQRGWKSITLHRASLKKIEQTTVAGCPELEGELLKVVEGAAEGCESFPFEEPSSEERQVRRLAHKLWDDVSGLGEDG